MAGPQTTGDMVSLRCIVTDVAESIDFYVGILGFEVLNAFPPAFADVGRGNLRVLLSGPTSSAGRALADGSQPVPGGWNRLHFVVHDITAEVAQLRAAGVRMRSDIVTGPGGSQVVFDDPSGNPVEYFQPANKPKGT